MENLGASEANEVLQRIMGNRGRGVNPADTDWGLSPAAQAAAVRLSGMLPPAKPVVPPKQESPGA